jgi:hypothetical protein
MPATKAPLCLLQSTVCKHCMITVAIQYDLFRGAELSNIYDAKYMDLTASYGQWLGSVVLQGGGH